MTQRVTTRRNVRKLRGGELLPALRPVNPADAEEPQPPVNPAHAVIYVNGARRNHGLRLPEADEGPAFVVERRTPTRAPDLRADVAVPFWQTVITGMVALVVAGLLAWAFGWSWRVVAVVVAVAVGFTWLARLRLVDALLWRIESASGRDVNRDGRIGRPLSSPVLVNPHTARERVARQSRTQASEQSRHDLLMFAAKCYTVGCSEKAHGVTATGPDRAQFVAQRDALMALGLAKWRYEGRPRAGWLMTANAETAARVIQEHVM